MNSEDAYKSCVIERTQKKLIEGYGIEKDIFKLLEDVEFSLIESKIIPNTNKESYLKLVKILFNDEETSEKIKISIKTSLDGNLYNLVGITALDFYSNCPEKVFYNEVNSTKESVLRKRFTIYADLMADGYKNETKIYSLINESEKFSKTERLVILHLILLNLSYETKKPISFEMGFIF
jgi:hypothetical protein